MGTYVTVWDQTRNEEIAFLAMRYVNWADEVLADFDEVPWPEILNNDPHYGEGGGGYPPPDTPLPPRKLSTYKPELEHLQSALQVLSESDCDERDWETLTQLSLFAEAVLCYCERYPNSDVVIM